VKTEAKSRIKACPGPDPGCGINFEPRFDRFDKLTASKLTASNLAAGRLTVLPVLPVLSAVDGSEVEGGSRKKPDSPGSRSGAGLSIPKRHSGLDPESRTY
jgi:hypothetical protein